MPVPPTLTPGERRGQGRAPRGDRERCLLSWLMGMRAGCLESLPISSPFATPAWGFICVLKDAHGDPHMCMLIEPKKQKHKAMFAHRISLTNQAAAAKLYPGLHLLNPTRVSGTEKLPCWNKGAAWPPSCESCPGSCR